MKTYSIMAIVAFSFSFFSAQGFGEDLFKDKNLKPVVTQSWKDRIMGSLFYGAAVPSALLPSWLTYRLWTTKKPTYLGAMLLPAVVFNFIPASIVPTALFSASGYEHFKAANNPEMSYMYNARIKSK